MSSARFKPILAIMIASIIWGAASPIFKWSLNTIPPFTLAFLRFSLAALLLYPFLFKKFYPIRREDWLKIIFFGLSGITINISSFFLGLRLAPSVNAAVIGSVQPFILLVMGGLFLKERVEKIEILGTVISFSGIFLIIFSPLLLNGNNNEFSFLGNLLFVVAMLGATGQTLIGRKLFLQYKNPLPISFYAFCVGAFTFFPLFIMEYLQNPGWLGEMAPSGFYGIFYGVIFASLIAYCFYDWALSKIEACEIGIFSYLMPITAIFIAVIFFGEKLTVSFLGGATLVLTGILLSERRLPHHPLHKTKKT